MMAPSTCGSQAQPAILVRLGHGDEVAAEEDPRHARQGEHAGGQRAAGGGLGAGEVGGAAVAHDLPARQELQGGGVRGAFGLDEHGSGPGLGISGPIWSALASAATRGRHMRGPCPPHRGCRIDPERKSPCCHRGGCITPRHVRLALPSPGPDGAALTRPGAPPPLGNEANGDDGRKRRARHGEAEHGHCRASWRAGCSAPTTRTSAPFICSSRSSPALIGGALSVLMRAELMHPGNAVRRPTASNGT